MPRPKPAVSKTPPVSASTGLKSPVKETKKPVEVVAVPSSPSKQETPPQTSRRKPALKGSPRKTKVKVESDRSPQEDAAKLTLALTTVKVPSIETASVVCQELISHEAVPVVKYENLELYRQRGNLRTIPRTSLSEELDNDVLTEEETEEEEGRRNKDDVVNCICGSGVDEGFMIQVRKVSAYRGGWRLRLCQ